MTRLFFPAWSQGMTERTLLRISSGSSDWSGWSDWSDHMHYGLSVSPLTAIFQENFCQSSQQKSRQNSLIENHVIIESQKSLKSLPI